MRLGTTELILILGIALVIFGPAKLPELGRTIGKTLREFKTQANSVTDEFKLEEDKKIKNKSWLFWNNQLLFLIFEMFEPFELKCLQEYSE